MDNPTTPDMIEAALTYAERGWPVFPVHSVDSSGQCSCGIFNCRDIAKHPRTRHGLNDATTNHAQIERWWSVNPEANIAVQTGPRSGVFVADVDPDAGGYETADRLEANHGGFAPTLAAATGGSGTHLYYRYPETGIIRNSTGKLGPGVDVRGLGGYALLPPSLHESGMRYAWGSFGDTTEITDAPRWLLSLLVEQPPAATSPRPPVDRVLVASGGPIAEGKRNSTLTQKAGVLRRYGFSESEILALLEGMNADRCTPPLPEAEVARIAKSVARYAPEPPRSPAPVVRLASGATLRIVGRRRRDR